MSYYQLRYHVIFSTYCRQRTINENREGELYAYLKGIIINQGGNVRAIGGMPDHVHIVLDIPPTIPVSDFIKVVKQQSSAWMRTNGLFPYWDRWEQGYAAFSCSPLDLDHVINYVNNQKKHHKKTSFQDEMQNIYSRAGITPYKG